MATTSSQTGDSRSADPERRAVNPAQRVRSIRTTRRGLETWHSQPNGRGNREHKLRPKPARQSPTLPMSGGGGEWACANCSRTARLLDFTSQGQKGHVLETHWVCCCTLSLIPPISRIATAASCCLYASAEGRGYLGAWHLAMLIRQLLLQGSAASSTAEDRRCAWRDDRAALRKTSASQACGSMSLSLAVSISV